MTRRPFPSIDELLESAEAMSADEGDPVTVDEVRAEGRQRSMTLSARFNPVDVARIRAIAQREGVGATQLVRSWVLEALEVAEEAGEGDESVARLMTALNQSVTAAKEARRTAQAELRRMVKSQRSAAG
ncbi:MAG: hypothetical protein H0V93_08905 [Euzebyales bacterium]|jgi:hypothetical protein|nr:hypothetical protein [Euzebyales bacterium]